MDSAIMGRLRNNPNWVVENDGARGALPHGPSYKYTSRTGIGDSD